MKLNKRYFIVIVTFLVMVFVLFLTTGSFCNAASDKIIKFPGLGIVFSRGSNNRITVDGVFKGSPADGVITAGDEIIRINDRQASHITINEIRTFMDSQPGTQVSLVIRREGKEHTVNLVAALYDITPVTVPRYEKASTRILGFESSNVIRVKFTGTHDYKKEDVFLLFDEEHLLCLAKIQQLNNENAQLLITRKWGEIHSYNAYKYQLLYCGSIPYERIRKEGDFLGEMGALMTKRVAVKKYLIGLDNDREIVARATLFNYGDLPVTDIKVKCYFVDYFGKVYGEHAVVVEGTLDPGQEINVFFRSKVGVREDLYVNQFADSLHVSETHKSRTKYIFKCKFEIDPDIQVINTR
jgi:hypothetical protein